MPNKVPRRVNSSKGGRTKLRAPTSKKRRAAGLPKDMKKLLTTISVLAVLLLTITTLGLAAQDSATTQVSWTVNANQSLHISSNGAGSSKSVESTYSLPEPGNADLKRGYIKEKNAIELVATSNVAYEVQVKAENSILGRVNGYKKPVSDLSIKGKGSFKQISSDKPVTIASGQPGEHKFGVDYKVQYDKDEYVEGDYVAHLEYTITVA